MSTTIPALVIRKRLGRDLWLPPEPFGPDGWRFDSRGGAARIIVSAGPAPDGSPGDWWHASMSVQDQAALPTYADMVTMHRAVWGDDGWSYQVMSPTSKHVNIGEVLHLWGRPDGRACLPNFGALGTI